MKFSDLEGKKIAIWGFGIEGQATLRALRKRLPDTPVTILNDTDLQIDLENTLVVTGASISKHLGDFDVVIKSPGVSRYKPEIIAAEASGVTFTSPTSIWFAEHPDYKTICITGTKGKSTTSALTAHALESLGYQVAIGGNFGVSLFDLEDLEQEPDYWVIELSSYQTADLEIAPTIAVLLNLFPEHLDWHGSLERYLQDKLNLMAHLGEECVSIINRTDPLSQRQTFEWTNPVFFNDSTGYHLVEDKLFHDSNLLLSLTEARLVGAHNHANICAVCTILAQLGHEPSEFAEALLSFSGLPHRLEILGEKDAITYVNDSISTVPESACAAVRSFKDKPITLLVGGYDRGLDWRDFARFIDKHPVNGIVTMPSNGDRIGYALSESTVTVRHSDDLADAVEIARDITPEGGVILLSPAAPSYGLFKNYQDRGQQFRHAVGLRCPKSNT